MTNVTDKSGRFSVDSVENYISLNETHVAKDKIIQQEECDELIKEMNGHLTCWCKFLNAGKETGHEKRIMSNFKNEVPPLLGHRTLRKDHKWDLILYGGHQDDHYVQQITHTISQCHT